ncbi:MAG: 6-phosphogluconolactonase, partial [Elusimicrobia bacterium]|nr:6-phosphogluconolactonase [Elusimicrobiota bacterium]
SLTNVHLLMNALAWEEAMDFEAVEKERQKLVEQLARELSPEALDGLVSESLAYRVGKVGYGDYYRYLRDLCREQGISLEALGALSSYIRYVLLAEQIEREGLLGELAQLEEAVRKVLARTAEQKRLAEANENLLVLEKLTRHAMTPEDFGAFQKNRSRVLDIGSELKDIDSRLPYSIVSVPKALPAGVLKPYEEFCQYALKRNQFLVANLLKQVDARRAKAAVLVAGGFHTEGLTKLFRDRDVSYVVVSPKITEVPEDGAKSLDVFARDPMPLEKLFSGETIYLASPRSTAAGAESMETALGRVRTVQGLFAGLHPALELALKKGRISREEAQAILEEACRLARRLSTIKSLQIRSDAREVLRCEIRQRKGRRAVQYNLLLAPKESGVPAEETFRAHGLKGKPIVTIENLPGTDLAVYLFRTPSMSEALKAPYRFLRAVLDGHVSVGKFEAGPLLQSSLRYFAGEGEAGREVVLAAQDILARQGILTGGAAFSLSLEQFGFFLSALRSRLEGPEEGRAAAFPAEGTTAEDAETQARYDEVFRRIEDSLGQLPGRGPPVLLADGPPGVGKSTLTEKFKDRLERSGRPVQVIETDWFITRGRNRFLKLFLLAFLYLPGLSRLPARVIEKFIGPAFYDVAEIQSLVKDIQSLEAAPAGTEIRRNIRVQVYTGDARQVRSVVLTRETVLLIEGAYAPTLFKALRHARRLYAAANPSELKRRFFERAQTHWKFSRLQALASRLKSIPIKLIPLLREKLTYDLELDLTDLRRPVLKDLVPHRPRTTADVLTVRPAEFARASAGAVAGKIRELQKTDPKKDVVIVFATGNTMKEFLDALAKEEGIDWGRIQAFHLDEYRGLSVDHPASFAAFLRIHFFSKVPIPAAKIHYIDGARPDISSYMDTLRELGGADIVMLGIGPDGHLAFNMPGSSFDSRMRRVALSEETIQANEPDYPDIRKNPAAFSMGLADILAGKNIFLLANQEKKADVVARALQGPVTEDVPASILQTHGNVTFILDEPAAARLKLERSVTPVPADGPVYIFERSPRRTAEPPDARVWQDVPAEERARVEALQNAFEVFFKALPKRQSQAAIPALLSAAEVLGEELKEKVHRFAADAQRGPMSEVESRRHSVAINSVLLRSGAYFYLHPRGMAIAYQRVQDVYPYEIHGRRAVSVSVTPVVTKGTPGAEEIPLFPPHSLPEISLVVLSPVAVRWAALNRMAAASSILKTHPMLARLHRKLIRRSLASFLTRTEVLYFEEMEEMLSRRRDLLALIRDASSSSLRGKMHIDLLPLLLRPEQLAALQERAEEAGKGPLAEEILQINAHIARRSRRYEAVLEKVMKADAVSLEIHELAHVFDPKDFDRSEWTLEKGIQNELFAIMNQIAVSPIIGLYVSHFLLHQQALSEEGKKKFAGQVNAAVLEAFFAPLTDRLGPRSFRRHDAADMAWAVFNDRRRLSRMFSRAAGRVSLSEEDQEAERFIEILRVLLGTSSPLFDRTRVGIYESKYGRPLFSLNDIRRELPRKQFRMEWEDVLFLGERYFGGLIERFKSWGIFFRGLKAGISESRIGRFLSGKSRVDLLARFLAFSEELTTPADVLILCGNHDLNTFQRAVDLYKAGKVKKILITGGQGRLTAPLISAIKNARMKILISTDLSVSLETVHVSDLEKLAERGLLFSEAEIIEQALE